AVLDRDDRARSEAVDARFLGLGAGQRQAGVQGLLLRLAAGILGDDALRDAGRFIDDLGHRPIFDQVLVLHGTGLLGDHRAERRVPFGNSVAASDDMAALSQQVRAIRHAVRRKLAPIHVEDRDLARARQGQMPSARVDDRRHVTELNRSVDRRFEVRLLVELRRAADVEGPHRQLRAGLADRLGGDDSDRLADIDRRSAREVASVAFGADALLRCAYQGRTDLHALDSDLLDLRDHRFVEELALGDDRVAALGIDDVLRRGATEHAIGERGDDRTALDDRTHLERSVGAAILFDDYRVLRHVDEAPRQITRVRRLERRVREALAGAVGRVEILEDGQALLEVRDDRSLD